jgi:hypothetical protein
MVLYGGDWMVVARFERLKPSCRIIMGINIMKGITNANTSGNIPQKAAHQKLNFFFFSFRLIDLNKAPLHKACDIMSIKEYVLCSLKV